MSKLFLDDRLGAKEDPDHRPVSRDGKLPDTVATPEGDGEFPFDQPLKPVPGGLQKTPAIDTNRV